MKKIFSILLALGLVLGLTVMAAPAVTAQCTGTSVTCAVALNTPVECETTCYNISVTLHSALSVGDKISVTFPTTAVISGATVTINGSAPLSVNITSGGEMHIAVNSSYSAGTNLLVQVCNVDNPPAGAYQICVKTVWDQCPCCKPFTITSGGSISPTAAVWCPCHNVTTTITWNASTNITEVNGWAWGTGNWAVVGNTLSINCSAMAGLGLSPCGVVELQVNFAPGCNRTLTVTVADAANVTLVAGWNLISLPIIPLSTNIEAVLADVLPDVMSVWYYDGCTDKWGAYRNGPADFGLTTMEAGKSYWVCMAAPGTLLLCGYELPCPPGAPPCYCYCNCWNMVGFKSTTNMTRDAYLANLNPALALFGALTWNATGWQTVDASTQMNPGVGYWMAFTEDVCFAPPV